MKEIKEPDLALAGLALLIIFGLLIWSDRPIESSRPFDPYTPHQDWRLTGYAYESWLWEDPFSFDHPDTDPKTESKPGCEDQLNEEISRIKKEDVENGVKSGVKTLVPLLKVQPNTAENKELRIRHRYAVIAGLIESGYRPLEPGLLHYCSIQKYHDKEFDVRWEYYRHKSRDDKPGKDKIGKPDIIVVWMNSEIFTDEDKFSSASGNLLELKEVSKDNFYILDLNNSLDQKHAGQITEKIIKKENFIKPVDDDKALTGKLAEELVERRNVKEPSEVLIITEQDSENVRNLASNFRKSLCDSFGKDQPDAKSSICEIRDVFYLKGVDAYRQQKIDKRDRNEDQVADKQAHRLSAMGLSNPPPLPIGPGQVDYAHRLAEQIKDPHHDLNLKKRDSGIKAVGIFGSDFYDKLLLMKALRAEMPHILVFTTDLDAQMLQPQHWRSARNLMVASHFDLVLKEEQHQDKEQHQKQSYQEQFPVFRDSWQTSIFYRTIEIVTNDYSGPQPRIFEVGRNGFVPLASPDKSAFGDALDKTIKRLELLAAIIFFLICFHWAFRPNSRRLSLYLLFGELIILFIALFFATDESGEPLSFTDGTSLWPTIFIQIIAILLAGYFFWIARKELDGNFYRLSERYFGINDIRNRPRCIGNGPRWLVIILPWIIFVALVASIAIYAINDVDPSGFLPFKWCLVLLLLILVFYLLLFEIEPWFVSVKHWREGDNCHTGTANSNRNCHGIHRALCGTLRRLCIFNRPDNRPVSPHYFRYESTLWREYHQYGLVEHRLARVVAIWLFFAIIETIVIYLLPPWPLPCRGPTCGWASWTGVLSFSVIMILLFFVLDAMRLSFYWIQKLRTQHPLLADRIDLHFCALDNAIRSNRLTPDPLDPLESLEKMVTVVAERTQVVDKLIYYPMLCIMLMLFAKITYFDNQDFPLSKGITFAVSISLLFFSGFMLRYEAEKLKLAVIKSAENLGKNHKCIQMEVDVATDRINGISDGVFQPMFEQPVMRALLIILLSTGLFAGKYLNLFG